MSLEDSLNLTVREWQFWVALSFVVTFAISRFNVTLPDTDDDVWLPLRARSFTTRFRFWMATAVYVGCYCFLYLLLLVGSTFGFLRTFIEDATNVPTDTPAWAALAATALLPVIPKIGHVDDFLRDRLQKFASIPHKAKTLASEVLELISPPEPKKLDDLVDEPPVTAIVGAIDAHRKRFEKLKSYWLKMREPSRVAQRYRNFDDDNQKSINNIFGEFSFILNNQSDIDIPTAQYVEKKHRSAVKQMSTLITCAMLISENTEVRIRRRWRNLGLPLKRHGLNFDVKTLLVSMIAISLSTIVFSFLAILLYYAFEGYTFGAQANDGSLRETIDQNLLLILGWGPLTVLIYLPPIAVAAAASMCFIDQVDDDDPDTLMDYVIGPVITFASTFLLSFMVLLAYGVVFLPFIGKEPDEIGQIMPWAIPPAAVATMFMVLSIIPRNKVKLEALVYVLCLSLTALLSSAIVAAIADVPTPHLGTLPLNSYYWLVALVPAGLGAALGLSLSRTRYRPYWDETSQEERSEDMETNAYLDTASGQSV